MIPILFEQNETLFANNGIARLRDCISCTVFEERNSIYECDFTYPITGANYELIKCGRIIGVLHDEGGDIQPFDIVSFSKPIDGIVTFHAVHISYRLKGYVVQDSNINTLSDALTALASSTPSNPFTYTADFTANGYASAFDGVPKSARSVLGGVEGSILDTYGGEYEWNKFNVILHNQRGTAVDFTIRYGFNMVEYNDEVDYSDSYTTAIPYWRGQDANGQETIVIGNKVDSGLTPYNGIERCVALDLSDQFESQPTTAQLEALALSKMTRGYVNNPHQSIEVSFVRLQDFSEYSQYKQLLQCKLCDQIKVVFPDYQTSSYFKIVRTEYDVLNERYSSMELGTLSTTLAEALGVNNSASYQGSSGGGGGGVTGVKGNSETNYRTGNVNLTAANIGALPSSTPIHNVPSGGDTNQVLAKNSSTDYDLKWITAGGGSIIDVEVNGTSVVTNGVASIPTAGSSTYGVITAQAISGSPYEYYLEIENEGTGSPFKVPLIYSDNHINAGHLPDATTSSKGAMTASDKTKLDGIASGAEVNVQSDWTEADSTSDAYIANKPTLFSGDYNDLTNKPTLATVATSGDYDDLSNKPNIPTGEVPYYTCSSAASNMSKTLVSVSSPLDAITTGCSILVKFENANTASQPFIAFPDATWNDLPIKIGANKVESTDVPWKAGTVVMFTCDGSAWQIDGWQKSVSEVRIGLTSLVTNGVATIPAASHTVTGVMLSTDKTKLDGLPTITTASVSLASGGWSSNSQTVTVSGVTSSNSVMVTYDPASRADWIAADIYCSAQATDSLTFTCTQTPSANITVNVVIIG